MGLRRSMAAVLLIGAALAAAATPARTAQAEVIDTASVGSPPDFPTHRVELAPSYDLARLTLPSFERITRDTGMAKALSLDSLVLTRAMVADSAPAQRAAPDRPRAMRNDSSARLSHSISPAMPASMHRLSVEPRWRHTAIVSNVLTAPSAYAHGRIIGYNAFPLSL